MKYSTPRGPSYRCRDTGKSTTMTTGWRDVWREKLVPAAEVTKHIKTGNRVFIGSACGEPQALIRALVESSERAEDTELLNVLTMDVAPYTELRYAERFRANAFFIGHGLREAVGQCRADYTPVFFSQNSGMLKIFHRTGLKTETVTDDGVVRVTIRLEEVTSTEKTAATSGTRSCDA